MVDHMHLHWALFCLLPLAQGPGSHNTLCATLWLILWLGGWRAPAQDFESPPRPVVIMFCLLRTAVCQQLRRRSVVIVVNKPYSSQQGSMRLACIMRQRGWERNGDNGQPHLGQRRFFAAGNSE